MEINIKSLKYRISILRNMDIQPSQKSLIETVDKKLKLYELYSYQGNLPVTTSKLSINFEGNLTYSEDLRSEDELINDLKIIYLLFGSTYETTLNYHTFRIRFKKLVEKKSAFYRILSDIYEDDVRICHNVVIGFWPFNPYFQRCDMEFSCIGAIEKYNTGCSCIYMKILDELKDIWNLFFDDNISISSIRYIPKVVLSAMHRTEIVRKSETLILTGKMRRFYDFSSKLEIISSKEYPYLRKFLAESGVVYNVDSDGVHIWNYATNTYGKLVGYTYDKSRYFLRLI